MHASIAWAVFTGANQQKPNSENTLLFSPAGLSGGVVWCAAHTHAPAERDFYNRWFVWENGHLRPEPMTCSSFGGMYLGHCPENMYLGHCPTNPGSAPRAIIWTLSDKCRLSGHCPSIPPMRETQNIWTLSEKYVRLRRCVCEPARQTTHRPGTPRGRVGAKVRATPHPRFFYTLQLPTTSTYTAL